MSDLMLDPDKNGCTIWVGKHIVHISGSVEYICEDISRRVSVLVNAPSGPKLRQVYDIGIDIAGCGRVYKDCLHRMGIQTYDITPRIIDDPLPRLR